MNSTFTFVCSNVLPCFTFLHLHRDVFDDVISCGNMWNRLTMIDYSTWDAGSVSDTTPAPHWPHSTGAGLFWPGTARCLDGPWRMSGSPFLTTDLNFNLRKYEPYYFWNILDMSCPSLWVMMMNGIVDILWYTSIHLLPTEAAGASLHLLLHLLPSIACAQ